MCITPRTITGKVLSVCLSTGDVDLNQEFELPSTTNINGNKQSSLPLGEIVIRLKNAYCNHIGVEFMFINERCDYYLGCNYYYSNTGMFVIG